jgi:hypothetical protein
VAQTGKRILTAQKSTDFKSGPTSLVAAEIHLGRWPAGVCGGWLHCNIQVVCHPGAWQITLIFNGLVSGWKAGSSIPQPISSRQPKN